MVLTLLKHNVCGMIPICSKLLQGSKMNLVFWWLAKFLGEYGLQL